MIMFFNNYKIHFPYTTCIVVAKGMGVYWVFPHLNCKIQKIQLDFTTSSLLPFRYCFWISNLSYMYIWVTRELRLLLPAAFMMCNVRVCDLREFLDPSPYFCATLSPILGFSWLVLMQLGRTIFEHMLNKQREMCFICYY